ncbi:hypothetical protein BROUX41_003272 [Berkeleyomyces rouxiae]|uniref:uncharacterized protein n=1 Tax=Berkeleyomyces rouxiae TaxID=2035830 RepID=UPI003B7D7675
MPRVSTLSLQPVLARLSERVGSDIRSGDAAFCRTALMWIVLGPALQLKELIDAIGLDSYTPASIQHFLDGLVSIDSKTGLVTAEPGLHEAVADFELALGFSDSEACYVIASRCLETCTFPFLPDGTPLEHLGRSGASTRAYAWQGWRFFFERAGKLDVHIEEKFDDMVKRTLHSLTSLVTLLAEQTVPCTPQTQPHMTFHARLEENGGLVLLYRALRRVLVAVRACLQFDCYAKALPLRPDTDGHVLGPGSMRRRRKRVSFADESFPNRASEEQRIIAAFRALERSLRIVAAIYSEDDEVEDNDSHGSQADTDNDNDCAIISDDEDDDKPPGRNERVRRWFLDAAVWSRNMADVYPAASHSAFSPRGYENVIQSEYMLQRPYLQCGKDVVQIPFVPWVAGVFVSAIKSPFSLLSSPSASQPMPVPTSPALCEKVASSTPKTLSITPAPSTSFTAVPISMHSPLASILPFPCGFSALRPANIDDAWRAAKHALLRGGIARTISYFTLAILINHVRRMLAPWLGQYVFYNAPLSALKLAISSPQVFLDENLDLICLRGFIAMELQKLLLDTTGAMAGNVLRWAAVFDVDSPRPGRLAVDTAVLVYLLTAMASLEYMFCRAVFTAAFTIATLRLGSPTLLSAHHSATVPSLDAVLAAVQSHSPLVPLLMLVNIVTALMPLAFNAFRQALCRGRFGLLSLLVLAGWATAHVAQFTHRYFIALELGGGVVALAYLTLASYLVLLDVLDDPLGVHIVHERLIKQIYSMGDVIFIDEVVDLRKLM